MGDYIDFLAAKQRIVQDVGFHVADADLNPALFDFQRPCVQWALRRGRAALFQDCGLGKSIQQLEWAHHVQMHTQEIVLILAPLAVGAQTVREGEKFGIAVKQVAEESDIDGPGIYVTNYERLHKFPNVKVAGVVLDESSILKSFTSKTKMLLFERFADTQFKLCCTATPAPNDVAELTNHAEFLGLMRREEMLAAYFVNDEKEWRLKGHAREPMFRWMASWAHALTKPSDIGYPDEGYALPPLGIIEEVVDAEIAPGDGQLFATDLGGVGGRAQVRRQTMGPRIERAARLAVVDSEQVIVWCGLNDEAAQITAAVPGAVNVEGSWSADEKAEALERFQDGQIRVLVTKPSIAGFGMNFQNCARMVFLGMGDSYEAYYQAIRRCWRFGQTRGVDVHVVVSRLETAIVENVRRKEYEATRWHRELVQSMATREEGVAA